MEHAKRCLGLPSILLLLLATQAQAQPREDHDRAAPLAIAPPGPGAPALAAPAQQRTRTFECKGEHASFEVLGHPGTMTTFYFPSPVLDVVHSSRALLVGREARKVTVQPKPTRKTFLGTIRVLFRTCEAHIALRRAARAEDAPLVVDIRQHDDLAEERAKLRAEHDQRMRALDDQAHALAQEKHRIEHRAQQTADTVATKLLLHDRPLMPVLGTPSPDHGSLAVTLGHGRWLDTGFFFTVEVENTGSQLDRIEEILVIDAAETVLDARVLDIESPDEPPDGDLATLGPEQRAKFVIKLPHAAGKPIAPLSIRIATSNHLQPMIVSAQDWYISEPLYPVTAEEKARREREERRRRREEKERERVTLHLLAIAGGIWLQDDLDQDRLDVTSITGLGARATYGLNRFFGFEVEAVGGRTGEAHFDDTDWNGMQGALLRSASLGRVQTGVAVRMGLDTVPTLRAGVGVQGASLSSRFLVNGNQAPGPDSTFDLDGLMYFGGGVDFRLGAHLVAGVAASFEKMMSSNQRSLEAGIHIGYGWKP